MARHGMNKFFDMDCFAKDAYCITTEENELWISMVLMRGEYREEYGIETMLGKAMSMDFKQVVIPGPTLRMRNIAIKMGFDAGDILLKQDGKQVKRKCMIWP